MFALRGSDQIGPRRFDTGGESRAKEKEPAMARKTRVVLLAAGTAVATIVSFVPAALSTQTAGAAASPAVTPTTIYDSTSTPLVPLPSLGVEAYSAQQIGNSIQFSPGSPRLLSSATVTMDSWGCQFGSWSPSGNTPVCTTTPGTSFTEPITLNLYSAGPSNSVGSLITSVTRTFTIPYRPSTDPTNCSSDPGAFLYAGTDTCAHGLPVNVTFPLGDTVVPDNVIWGVAYNSSDEGPSPYGQGTSCFNTAIVPTPVSGNTTYDDCGYDSLNVGLTVANGPSVGTDPLPGTIYWSTTYAGFYCDGGSAGTGTFRLDSADDNGAPCWGDSSPGVEPWDIPAAQFSAVPEISVASSNTASIIGHTVTFTVTAPPTATHSVSVRDAAGLIGSCTLSGGACTVSTSLLPGGIHTITAVYGGDGTFPAFTSAPITQSILTVPAPPTSPAAVPGNRMATITWTAPSNGGTPITGYTVTSSPGGKTCTTTGATSCTITGLTDGTPYTFGVTATNLVGTSSATKTVTGVTPARTGFHIYGVPPVIANGKKVTISVTGAQAYSLLSITVAKHGTKQVFADSYGAGAQTFTIAKSGTYAMSAKSDNANTHGTLYIAHVTTPVQVSHLNQVPITVKFVIPGSVVQVTTSDGGNFKYPVSSSGRVTIDLPPAKMGTLHVTITDEGYLIGQPTVTIF
jgi:Big-like domain-containing protein/fibronectin type III domain protein